MTDHSLSYHTTSKRNISAVKSAIDGDGNLDEYLVPALRAMMELGRASVNEVCRLLRTHGASAGAEVTASSLIRLRRHGVLSVSRDPGRDSPNDYNVYELLVYEEAFCDALLGKHFVDRDTQRWVAWAWETAHGGPVVLLRPLAEDGSPTARETKRVLVESLLGKPRDGLHLVQRSASVVRRC
jgi:hypothetical protein